MKYFIILLAIVLSGCQAVPVKKQAWPDPPGLQSTVPCPDLLKLEKDSTLSQVSKTITVNYTEYYMCAIKLGAWQEWYKIQKNIYEGVDK